MALKKLMFVGFFGCIVALLAGCATQVTEEPNPVKRTEVPFGQYDQVILVKSKIAPKYDNQGPNLKAVKKIDEILASRIPPYFKNFKVVTLEELEGMDFSSTQEKQTLLIKPYVKQVKFIGGAARFWAGAMAGSSVVIMDTAFTDAATGKVIANPGYYRKAGAYADPFGTGSNRMLEDVAQDIVNYTAANM